MEFKYPNQENVERAIMWFAILFWLYETLILKVPPQASAFVLMLR